MKAFKKKLKKGSTLVYSTALLALIVVVSTSYIDRSTQSYRSAKQNLTDVQLTMIADAGLQAKTRDIWGPFKVSQAFTTLDHDLPTASPTNPLYAASGLVQGVGRYSTAVIGYVAPSGDTYNRQIKIRVVAWRDDNNNGVLDPGEPSRTVDAVYNFGLQRSAVFDYTYFVNNFGWMTGFGQNDLQVNGDMRSNGDFTFTSGSGTVNGSIVASYNSKLAGVAGGVVNQSPYKLSDSQYEALRASDPFGSRMRPAYSSQSLGAVGSSTFESYRDLVYQDVAQMDSGRSFGSVIEDSSGTKSWSFNGSTQTTNVIDSTPSQELVMPDLSSFGSISDPASSSGLRFAKSKAWTDTKATFMDGTANPNYTGNSTSQNELNDDGTPNVNYTGAYLDIWNSSLNGGTGAYQRVSSGGVVSSSVLLPGTSAHPIRLHGPVAVNGDIAIAGYVSGQGTIYCSRNAHIVGSVIYSNPPDFSGTDLAASDQRNEKRDMLGIAASASVMMGDTSGFGYYPLVFMEPPFTQARTDDNGNAIPAFNATELDQWGIMRYQSLLETNPATASAYRALASGGINQIDAVMYTNFTGGGNVGTNGNGFTINGSIISRDEAMVVFSLPMRMNYDTRIRERSLSQRPLIDIDVPRSPILQRLTWQDRGIIQA